MKKTAVEWLEERLTLSFGDELKSVRGFFVIAKEMEKEQMIDWYATGQADTVNMYEQHLKKPSNTNEK
jgi:hypothetical protein